MAEFKSLQETAYNYIRNKVLTGQLQPGVLYSETKAAAEINISRTPMKDALVRLSQDQLIDIIPSKGFRLHRMSIEDVLHTYQARTAVEGFCAMQLAQRRNEPDGREALRVMRECLTDMELFLKQEPLEDFLPTFLEHDVRFHQALVDFSRNAELLQLFRTYHYRLYFFALETLRVEGRAHDAYREHSEILQAVTDPGDQVGMQAYLAIVRHMEITRDMMLTILPPEGGMG